MKELTFEQDLIRGGIAESLILKEIQQKHPRAYKKKGYFKDYDIYVPEVNKSIEVKFDERCSETGNVVVEIQYNGNPSALMTTKADYWVFVTHEYTVWTTPDLIWECIHKFGIRTVAFIGTGDDKLKRAYLIPLEQIKQLSILTKTTNYEKEY